ncbi:MAG: DUF5809 family protein [Natronomonas sp.]
MNTGTFSPSSWADARRQYEMLGPAAQTVVKETAKAMEFDREEYDDRIDGTVVETARQALFASLLSVEDGTMDELTAFRESRSYTVHVAGSDTVERAVWHDAPFAETAVAATFQEEPEAAAATLRRMAFNRIYREELCDG